MCAHVCLIFCFVFFFYFVCLHFAFKGGGLNRRETLKKWDNNNSLKSSDFEGKNRVLVFSYLFLVTIILAIRRAMNQIHVLMVACVNNITIIFLFCLLVLLRLISPCLHFFANVSSSFLVFFFVYFCFNTLQQCEPIARTNERNQLSLTDTADEK